MLHTVSMMPQYVRAFREAVRTDGWRFALRRAAGFVQGRVMPRLQHYIAHNTGAPEPLPPFQDIIATLGAVPVYRPLLLIVSNIQIRQCVHYRIQQKLRYLDAIGVQAMHISPGEIGRIRAFSGLAHSVIIYRTALQHDLLQHLRKSGARILFEFDDLVVGQAALEKSGILSQVTESDGLNLRLLSADLLETAQKCDGIIVSTPYLAQIYARAENGLADKSCFVIPNFVETDDYALPGQKDVTFAYTSPSGSIRQELAMLTDFLSAYDAAAQHDWTILVMGNDMARKELDKLPFRRGRVISQPFSAFADYLAAITRAETVLIPLADNDFNQSKTAIRLMDAAISGTQALFCPVGGYRDIQDSLNDDGLCLDLQAWPQAGGTIASILARQEANVADLQQAVRRVYGVEAAKACYRQVFMEQLGISPVTGADSAVAL